MSWKQERSRIYKMHLDDISNLKTPLQRRKYIIKQAMTELQEIGPEMKGNKKWDPREVRNFIHDMQDRLEEVETRKDFDRTVMDYVIRTNPFMDKKVMHYRYETSSSGSFEEESASESSESSELDDSSESYSESESESSEELSEESSESEESAESEESGEEDDDDNNDEIYN